MHSSLRPSYVTAGKSVEPFVISEKSVLYINKANMVDNLSTYLSDIGFPNWLLTSLLILLLVYISIC
jgi:hypothetical protein